MLEVMSAASAELSRPGGDPGILLNCWDKSSPLIKELERTVNFAERKCGDLMQELHYYKECYEKWAQFERVNHFCLKKKVKKFCKLSSDFGSSSENEFEKANRYFYRKIKSKINEVNNEISQANRKIHSRAENLPLDEPPPKAEPKQNPQGANDPPPSSLAFENKACKSEPTMTACDVADPDAGSLNVTEKHSSNSVPDRKKTCRSPKKDSEPSKRRYASLQRFKIRSKSLPQGVRRKFGFGGYFEVFEADEVLRNSVKSRSKSRTSLRADSSRSFRNGKSKTRLADARRPTPKSSRLGIKKSKSDVRQSLTNAKHQPEWKRTEISQKTSSASQKAATKEANACTAVVPSGGIVNASDTDLSLSDNLRNLIAKPNALLPFLRHPIPFIPCSSTSKTFNLGLNVQQVLSMIKRKRHSIALQAIVRSSMQAARSITEPPLNTLFIGQATTSHSQVTSAICPAGEASEDGFSVLTNHRSKCSMLKQVQTMRTRAAEEKTPPGQCAIDGGKLARPEDVWVVDQDDAEAGRVRNSRSKCTCFPSKHCVDYNKVLRQYTGWGLPPAPPAASSSRPCSGSGPLAVPSGDNVDRCGEGDGRTELLKVHNDLLNLTRKYSSLQEQISRNCLDDYEANAELDAMESELAIREVEFKDILNFYNQLIVLKEKLRSLRPRVGQGQAAARRPERQRPRRSPPRPTPSMALAKVLKKIQGLQDKIQLIDAP